MPKVLYYSKGSIVFFEGDKDDRIFILQSGEITLKQKSLETGAIVDEKLTAGEFFGVKSGLARMPRMETAIATTEAQAVWMTPTEFETIFGKNKDVILKMLKVFSRSLRDIHLKTEKLLKNEASLLSSELGMLMVAKAFFEEEQFKACSDICERILNRYPNSSNKATVSQLLSNAKRQKTTSTRIYDDEKQDTGAKKSNEGALKQFSLPVFDRFSHEYEDGSVIISEFEPGESFFIIQDGEVYLEKCVKGSMRNLDILSAGDFFGEMAILDNSPRSCTCLARGKVKCLEFNKDNFNVLITGNPQMALMLLKGFCKRIYDQSRRFRTLTISDLQARIADVFLMYNEMTPLDPVATADSVKRTFSLTLSDVAHWAGISTDAARDELDKFSGKKKIEIYDDHIVVANIMDMKRIVDMYFTIKEANAKM